MSKFLPFETEDLTLKLCENWFDIIDPLFNCEALNKDVYNSIAKSGSHALYLIINPSLTWYRTGYNSNGIKIRWRIVNDEWLYRNSKILEVLDEEPWLTSLHDRYAM